MGGGHGQGRGLWPRWGGVMASVGRLARVGREGGPSVDRRTHECCWVLSHSEMAHHATIKKSNIKHSHKHATRDFL